MIAKPTWKLAPSILAADFSRLGEQMAEAEAAGVDYFHVDVMDGHFVPNITFGPSVVESIRKITKLPLDIHLMIENPDQYIPQFARAGGDFLTVHAEASKHLHQTVHLIREHGKKPGIALNPATPITAIEELVNDVDLILIMTVNPGFGGQQFIKSGVDKIKRMRQLLDACGSKAELAVDGGVNAQTIADVAGAGATMLVAGSAIYTPKESVATAVQRLRGTLAKATT
ncbi:MAG: ribulose-phosphate 3-epimerase [Dehalococcoidia bacterium]|nr:ribulose-phosphate 3-epimerase [Dehalococcoidia bacterium]